MPPTRSLASCSHGLEGYLVWNRWLWGQHSQHSRLRKCAWAVVLKQDSASIFLRCWLCVCGLLVDSASPHIVSRDELSAFVELMRRTHGPLRMVVGAKFVVQGWKQLSFGSVHWHCHGDLWVAALQHETRDIQLYKIKSHLQLEVFLAVDPAAEWVWHANNSAALLCDQKAGTVDMQAHTDTLSWFTGRAWRLNEWLLPRVRLWITWKWDAAAQPGAAAVGTTRLTRGMLFIETKTDRTAGHEWLETGKNIKCTLCGCELKYYMKLEKPKVSMAFRCTAGVRVVVSGSGLHPNLHCTHTMTLERGRKYLCQLCRRRYTSGVKLSLKLKRPCKVTGG